MDFQQNDSGPSRVCGEQEQDELKVSEAVHGDGANQDGIMRPAELERHVAVPRPRRLIGYWEAAVASAGGVNLAAWALDAENQDAPVAYVFRWEGLAVTFEDLIMRADVARANGCIPLACGLKTKLNLTPKQYPEGKIVVRPALIAVWDDGTEFPLKPLNSTSESQFFWNELGLPDPEAAKGAAAAKINEAPQSSPAQEKTVPAGNHEGAWEQAVFTTKGVTLAAWAYRRGDHAAPVAYEFRWGGGVATTKELVARDDVARNSGQALPPCGLSVEIPFSLEDIPEDAHTALPRLFALWDDGTESEMNPAARKEAIQFRFMAFENRAEFTQYFQNPAFRIKNNAIVAWASRRALSMFGDDVDLFMSAFCVMIYRHLESGFFPVADITSLIEDWHRLEAGLAKPYKGERLRWVISVKLALGYFYMVQKDSASATKNFVAISQLDEHLASWPQASTNLLIGVFMAAWFEYREGDSATAIARLSKAYTIFKNGVTHLPVWSKHHFSELDNSLRIAGECFGLQKLLEGETREHILPISSKPTFAKISIVLRDLIARGQIEDGPFPVRADTA